MSSLFECLQIVLKDKNPFKSDLQLRSKLETTNELTNNMLEIPLLYIPRLDELLSQYKQTKTIRVNVYGIDEYVSIKKCIQEINLIYNFNMYTVQETKTKTSDIEKN